MLLTLTFSEIDHKRSDYLTENVELTCAVGILGFFIGAINQSAIKTEEFKRNSQLAIYTDKKAASVKIILQYYRTDTLISKLTLILSFNF